MAQSGDPRSANAILPFCKNFNEKNSRDFGKGYCAGAVAGMMLVAGGSVGRPWCAAIPDEVTVSQTVRVVVRYIEARPNRMHESFTKLALEALVEAWPCQTPAPPR
jgi:hypothetical protein